MSGRILIVEHDPVIATDLYILADDLGFDVAEPVGSVADALAEVERGGVGGALLDCNLMGETSRRVAETLAARDTPFAYVTGEGALPDGWPQAPVLHKPLGAREVETLLRGFG